MYLIKVGDLYLTPDGTFSGFQSRALRVTDGVRDVIGAAPLVHTTRRDVRLVHLKPRQTSQSTTYHDDIIDPRD